MHILILEDSPGRIRSFAEWLAPANPTVVHTVADAYARLSAHHYDWVFLDHELGYNQPTGSDLTKLWRQHHSQLKAKPKGVLLHTSSEIGANRMAADLQAIGLYTKRVSFFYLDKDKLHEILHEDE